MGTKRYKPKHQDYDDSQRDTCAICLDLYKPKQVCSTFISYLKAASELIAAPLFGVHLKGKILKNPFQVFMNT